MDLISQDDSSSEELNADAIVDPATFIINLSLANRVLLTSMIACFLVAGCLFKIVITTKVVRSRRLSDTIDTIQALILFEQVRQLTTG